MTNHSFRLLQKRFPVFPVLGLLSTLTGTCLAVQMIPVDISYKGALFLPGVVMMLGLMGSPIVAYFKAPLSAFRAEHILVLSPIAWLLLDVLQGLYPLDQASRNAVIAVFWLIFLFVGGVWIAALARPWRTPAVIIQASSYDIPSKTLFRLVMIFFALGILRFAYPSGFDPMRMLDGLLADRWSAPWSRGALGGWDAFIDHLGYFGYVLPTLVVVLARKEKLLSGRVVVAALLALVMTAFLVQGGGRRIIVVIWGAALLCWVLQQKTVSLRQFAVLFLGLGILAVTVQAMLAYRRVGLEAVFQGTRQEIELGQLNVDDNFLRVAQIVDLVPAEYPYVYARQILYVLARPIPRVFWPGKPTDPGFDLAEFLGLRGVSLSSSVLGEFYLSAGWLGVLIGGFIYGKLAGMIAVLLLRPHNVAPLVYSLSAMTLFAAVRSMIELVLMSYAVLAWVAGTRVFAAIKNKRSRKPRRSAHPVVSGRYEPTK